MLEVLPVRCAKWVASLLLALCWPALCLAQGNQIIIGGGVELGGGIELGGKFNQNFLVIVMDDPGKNLFNSTLFPNESDDNNAATPNIDTFATNGILFTHAYSTAVCGATMAQLMTGRFIQGTGTGTFSGNDYESRQWGTPTLLGFGNPAYIGRRGAFGKLGLSHGVDEQRTASWIGFDSAIVFVGPTISSYGNTAGPSYDFFTITGAVRFPAEPISVVGPTTTTSYHTAKVTDDVLSFISAGGSTAPYYVMAHYYGIHTPFHEPPGSGGDDTDGDTCTDAGGNVACADLMLEDLDTEIGQLIAGIDLTSTCVILFTDNGSEVALGGGKFSPKESGISIPFFVQGRCVADSLKGTRSDELISVTDIHETILDLANATYTGGYCDVEGDGYCDGSEYVTQGESLRPLLDGQGDAWTRTKLLTTSDAPTKDIYFDTVLSTTRKLVNIFGTFTMFNWVTDPDNTSDLCGSEATLCANLQTSRTAYCNEEPFPLVACDP